MAPHITYTMTDEAPMLATYSLLPILRRFLRGVIDIDVCDISLSARILAQFPDRLTEAQRVTDDLSILDKLCKSPDANIIKLPNISASVPQLMEAITELQQKGYNIPNYCANPHNDEERDIFARYGKVLGSAVNPVLREGNSDRRVAAPVKKFAQKQPHKLMPWKEHCPSRVSSMTSGDFCSNEKSYIATDGPCVVDIVHVNTLGEESVLKGGIKLGTGEIMDGTFMSVDKLNEFLSNEMSKTSEENLLLSVHLKATMMKISDPIIFGHVVKVYFKQLWEKHSDILSELHYNPNNGLQDLYDKIANHPSKAIVEATIADCYQNRPPLAMVDSDKGITNLHVPSDIIVDASMPVVIRDGGCMWDQDGKLRPTVCIIPDHCYAPMYSAMFDDVKEHGQYNVTTMGNVANVGLMAQKAEEYGSHDKTFEIKSKGTVKVIKSGEILFEHEVSVGDIWRACLTKDAAIKDWVGLTVRRAKAARVPAIFWLDDQRAHDRCLIQKVQYYLKDYDTRDVEITIMDPVAAMKKTLQRVRLGQDTISSTGNVLRDYLTDLFPILELGTSAKMLSIVPLLAGGGMFETGAGGSAPKHVEQFVNEGHLRWDSLGEYLAIAVSLEDFGAKTGNERAKLLGQTLTEATGKLLDTCKFPSRKGKEIDNRGSTYYIALYWSQALACHDSQFSSLANDLAASETLIMKDLLECQGTPIDIGGYYKPEFEKVSKAMRPSATLNRIIDSA